MAPLTGGVAGLTTSTLGKVDLIFRLIKSE
jgi:hypothetical protein